MPLAAQIASPTTASLGCPRMNVGTQQGACALLCASLPFGSWPALHHGCALHPLSSPFSTADSDLDDLDDEDDSDDEDLDGTPSLDNLPAVQPPADPAPAAPAAGAVPRKRKATPPPDGGGGGGGGMPAAVRRSVSPAPPGAAGGEAAPSAAPLSAGLAAAAAKRPRVEPGAAASGAVTEEEVRTLLQARGRMPLKEIVAHFRARATGDNAKAFTALMRRVSWWNKRRILDLGSSVFKQDATSL